MSHQHKPLVYILCGVCGSGKSSVGALLAAALGCPFHDADSFHSAANISKMRAGIPLTDDDRWPWLEQLRQVLAEHICKSQPAVMACSALKPAYRQLLRSAAPETPGNQQDQQQQQQQRIAFILLNPPRAHLKRRLQARAAEGAHFMPESLLDSQLQQLEVPHPQTELYMCFGSIQGTGAAEAEADAAIHSPAESDISMPSPQQIVDAILSR